MTTTRVPGRPRSIPTEHFDTVLKLYAAGEGYRRIAKQLASITTSVGMIRLLGDWGMLGQVRQGSGWGGI